MTVPANIAADKKRIFDFADRNAEAIARIGDHIFYFGELGMQEYRTSQLMCDLLEKNGFTVERGISGFPTGFCATYGSGKPVVAMHCEYDANPDNSQAAGVPRQQSIVEGAPGHCEGHNVNAAVLVGAALAAKDAMQAGKLPGTLKVFGAPAEEQLISRPYYVRDGWFKDVDAAFHAHIGGEFRTRYGVLHCALISAHFTFHGETAHAGVAPWKGRDALDAAVLMDMGLAQYREHMTPTMGAQRVITKGGDQPNVVPKLASVWWYFRDNSGEGCQALFEQAKKIAQGAALMTNTRVEVDIASAVWPARGNQTLAGVLRRNIELVGMPEWTREEDQLAREVQAAANVKVEGLRTAIPDMSGEQPRRRSANDSGDVTWVTPSANLHFPSNIPNISNHHWAAGVALATSIAHKGAVAGVKVLASAIVDCFADPSIVAEAQRTFKEELGGQAYTPLIPAGQKPPVDLNRAMMDRFRPSMEKTYLSSAIEFR